MKLKTFSIILLSTGILAILGVAFSYIFGRYFLPEQETVAIIGGAEIPGLLPDYNFFFFNYNSGIFLKLLVIGAVLIIAAVICLNIKKEKTALLLLGAIHSVISGFFTPWLLMLSFNLSKGPVNNPEGVMFIPVGIIVLLAFLAIDILIIVKTVKSNNLSRTEKLILISAFIILKILCLALIDQNGLRNFLKYFNIRYLQRGIV